METTPEQIMDMLIVCAAEGYAATAGISTAAALKLFRERGVLGALRSSYETLHTQDPDEAVEFAKDYLRAARA